MERSFRGRTFFDQGAVCPTDAPAERTLCFVLHRDSVPANAQLFGDVREQVVELRTFCAVVLSLWQDRDAARARIAWKPDGTTYLRVVFSEAMSAEPVGGLVDEALTKAIALDVKRVPRLRNSRWKLSDLLLDRSQWDAMVASGGCNWLRAPPADVAFDGGRSATLLRVHLRDEVLWHKLLPHQQEFLYPDVPWRTQDAAQAAELSRAAATVPLPPGACRSSEWELFVQRAAKMRAQPGYKEWAVRQLACTLQGDLAGYVPPPERVLNEYEMAPLSMPWPYSNLSSFGTWATFLLTSMDVWGFVFSQHVTVLKAYIGALDVYLEKKPGSLHFNMMLAGPAASSKSFTLTLLTSMLVPGTVSVATRRTANSKSYDTDSGAAIDVEHELTKEFFGQGTARVANPRGAQTKDVMTSHEFVTEAVHCTDEGRRVQVISKSRCHRALFCATNDFATGGADSNDRALLSRFDVVFPTLGGGARKDLLSVMVREKDPTPHDEAGFDAFVGLTRRMHVCAYWVQRLISAKAMDDVDFSALKLVLSEVCAKIHIRAPPARTTERIFSLARVCTIITAIVEEFALPGAPQRNVTPTVAHMTELQDRLVCTAEIAKFCVELQRSELEQVHDRKIAAAMRDAGCEPDADDPSYVTLRGARNCDDLFRQVAARCGTQSGVTPEVVAQWLGSLTSRQLRNVHTYRVVGPGDAASNIGVVPDTDAPRATALGCKGFAVHASIVEAGGAAHDLADALETVCCSTQHDEITAQPTVSAPSQLRTRPAQPNAEGSGHVMRSGLYVHPEQWTALGVEAPKQDLERMYGALQMNAHVERFAKRRRVSAPQHAKQIRYGPSNTPAPQTLIN